MKIVKGIRKAVGTDFIISYWYACDEGGEWGVGSMEWGDGRAERGEERGVCRW